MLRNKLMLPVIAMAVVQLGGGIAFAEELTLDEGIEKVLKGQWFKKGEIVKIGRHGFELRPVKILRVKNGVRAESYFRHKVKGQDDQVYFTIDVREGKQPKAKITKIVYRGLFGNKTVRNILVTQTGLEGAIAIHIARRAQRLLVGAWEPAAGIIIGRMAGKVEEMRKAKNLSNRSSSD